jgi:beta-lactam-binding protein with PASTA domain
MAFPKLDFGSMKDDASSHLRLFIAMAVGVLIFAALVAVVVFFLTVRGAEETMVPNVVGKELTSALLELQVKELYPRIQLRYSQDSRNRGQILEQEPKAGAIVKAGRRIRLVVSQGVMISTIASYLGRDLNDVRMELQTLISGQPGSSPLLSIKNPVMYAFSDEKAGTILQQTPEAGSPISGPTALEFVVSKGPEARLLKIPKLLGLSIEDAMSLVAASRISFTVTLRETADRPGFVVAQNPAGGVDAAPGTRLAIEASCPRGYVDKAGNIYGLYTYTMAKNPYPLETILTASLPGGDQETLFSGAFAGGQLTVPYMLPTGSTLVLTVLGNEVNRTTIGAPNPTTNGLSLDQL